MIHIEVCLSTALFGSYDVHGKNVVVIDVLRATTSICAAFGSGVSRVFATDDFKEALDFQKTGWLVAGESDGVQCDGFDFGNSPLHFGKTDLSGKDLVFYTTNGTRAIRMVPQSANNIVIAGMSNLNAVIDFLKKENKPVLLFCAGWKGQPSVEDTFCAGAICDALTHSADFELINDPAVISQKIWKENHHKAKELFMHSEHGRRLARLGFTDDVEFCSLIDTSNVLPVKQDTYFCNHFN